jgi:DNA-binding NtrC family response regulator
VRHRASAGTGSARPGREGVRVLIVDDDDSVRRVLARGLQRLGYSVDQVDSAAGAKSRLLDGTRFHLVVTDVHLGDGYGTQAVADTVARDRAPSVLVVSGSSDEDADEARRRLPSWIRSAFLPKPFALEDLERALADLLGSESSRMGGA